MKLAQLEIRNYRSLFYDYDTESGFVMKLADGVNVIAGPNNTGKSNIFRALALALDPDFHFDRARDMPAPLAWRKPTITLTFQVPTRRKSSQEATLLRYLADYEKKANPNATRTYASQGIVKLRVTIEGGDNTVGTRRQVFVASGGGARTLPDGDPLAQKAMSQFNKCFHFVLIRSGESLATLMEGKFRDILQNVLREELTDAYVAAEKSRENYGDELRSGLLEPLTNRIAGDLKDLFPEIHGVSLRPDIRGLDETLTRMRIEVSDAAVTDLENKGTGVRGGLIIAMLRHFAEVGRRSMLFAVEEPESFLHPAAQERLREDLEALAMRPAVSLLMTTHSPYIVSRRSDAKVFAIDKDQKGRTTLVNEAAGNAPQAGVLGGLFRDRLVVEVLDRSSRLPLDTRMVVVVEGTTDRRYAEIALAAAGRLDLLAGVAFVEAGFGQTSDHAGGASLAVMQSLVSRAMSAVPVVVLLDNDEEGSTAEKMLLKIGNKTKEWRTGKTVFNYRCVFNGSSKEFPYEAEDLWPDRLFETFIDGYQDERLQGRRQRPKPEGGWHFDLKPKSKGEFVDFLSSTVRKSDCAQWVDLYERMRAACGLWPENSRLTDGQSGDPGIATVTGGVFGGRSGIFLWVLHEPMG